jgi:3'-phosphoadenosine 5'-phosphosulfate sulfotransferase (PAPS reductase)/FAD synthetase
MIVVWFSCGAASAVAAKLTLGLYPDRDVRIVNNPIIEEDLDNERFLRDVEAWLGVKVTRAVNSKYPSGSAREVWEKRQFMSGIHGAPCTLELKKAARQQYERENKVNFHVLGFTADERARHDRFVLTERDNVLPVLIDAGMTKQDCVNYLHRAGIELPEIYSKGFPNANCVGCVKATSPTYWNLVRREYPEVFADRAEQSQRLGVRLARHNNVRVFLSDLPATAVGRPLRTHDIPDCGIFCEEAR